MIRVSAVDDDLFGRIVCAWASEPAGARVRGIAMDVALIHIASMSNLMAALGWAIVDLLIHPEQRRDVTPGWTIATLLPLLNTSAAPGLQIWDPDRWHRHRLADVGGLASPTLVTAFGHGRHSCPAQPFSLSAMTMAMIRLLARYDMTPGWDEYPRPVSAQIGGVARSAWPCRIDYARR